MEYVKKVNPAGVLEIECRRGFNNELVCRCVATDYCDYTPEDLVTMYRRFGLTRRSAEYVVKEFRQWYSRRSC